jgi:hypothetical protein
MSNVFIIVSPSNNYIHASVRPGDLTFYPQSSNQKILLGTSNATTSLPTIVIQGSNVGIGKSNPTTTLDIFDGFQVISSGETTLRVAPTNTSFVESASFLSPNLTSNIVGNYTGITLQKDFTSNYNGWLLAHVHQGEMTSSNYFGFSPNGFGFNMALLGSSNIGINTTSPLYLLDVNGQCRVNTHAPIAPNRPFIRGCFNPGNAAGNITLLSFYAQGGMTVTSSSRLVAPVSGLYSFGFQTIMATTTVGRADIYIILNGSSYILNTLNEDNGSGYHFRNASFTMNLNANDYIVFNLNTNNIYGGQAAGTYEPWRTFWFYLVG